MKKKQAVKKHFNGAVGLPLSRRSLRVLRDAGIFCNSIVTVEHQELAQRDVVRGVESGGSVSDVGRYVTFANEEGHPMEYLHAVESIGVNGIHAVVVAASFVRVEMIRKAHTYDLLITRHAPGQPNNGSRPGLQTEIVFRGHHGRVELDLVGKDKLSSGRVEPTFYGLSGEPRSLPEAFRQVVISVTRAVNCVNCSHSHYVRAPKPVGSDSIPSPASTDNQWEGAA